MTRRFLGSLSLLLGVGCLDRPIGNSEPVTTNIVVQRQGNSAITGIDLLLMIDNSSSMADKQAVLAAAVPQLLGQLVQPNCVDSSGNALNPPVAAILGAPTPCPPGSSPEFNPVNNIHVGIVTSSIGDHGAGSVCTPGTPTNFVDPTTGQSLTVPPDDDDQGHLMGTLTRGASATQNDQQSTFATIDGSGFLAWGNSNLPTGVGQADLTDATKIFTDWVVATAENGCGYEAQLEGWFRFLVDPVPPVHPIVKVNNQTSRVGSDDTVLNERAAFLRPDSLVAIIMLTDENSNDYRDTDVGWVALDSSSSIETGSPGCSDPTKTPNDKCCFSCTVSTPPAGCQPCAKPPGPGPDDGPTQLNLREWQNKRRFGYDFMYPASRYVVALTKKELCPDQSFGDMDCDCEYATKIGASCSPGTRRFPNPLYSTIVGQLNNGQSIVGYPNSIPRADNSLIFLVGIIGVPWQDIGTLDANGNLQYIPVTDPAWTGGSEGTQPVNPPSNGASGIWDMIYGDDNNGIHAKDPRMVEDVVPRSGLPGPVSGLMADPINGHEFNTGRFELEYACIFPLPTSRPCACDPTSTSYAACKYLHVNDCCDLNYPADGAGGPGGDFDRPLCQNASGTYDRTQYYAKAYPSLREIQVLHDYATSGNAAVQGNSVVASICPKDLTSVPTSPGYGYNPAVSALISRLKEKLKGSCLPRPLTVNSDGTLPCSIVEAVPADKIPGGQDCTSYCQSNGRDVPSSVNPNGPPNAQMAAAVMQSMSQIKICDGPGLPACSSMCLCELPQESGTNSKLGTNTDLWVCQNANDGSQDQLDPGYCYVDPANGAGTNNDLVAKCPATQRRILRFVGNNPSGGGHPVPLPGALVFSACQGSSIANAPPVTAADAGP